jgi:hypothetical protein
MISRRYDLIRPLKPVYFSIVDVIAVLSESVNPRDYWFRMKVSVKSDDGLELSIICAEPGDSFCGEL